MGRPFASSRWTADFIAQLLPGERWHQTVLPLRLSNCGPHFCESSCWPTTELPRQSNDIRF
jgi:hypothetical protein